jgi:hypothetical protein
MDKCFTYGMYELTLFRIMKVGFACVRSQGSNYSLQRCSGFPYQIAVNSGEYDDVSISILRNHIRIFFVIPFYVQCVPVHSANCVETYAVACRRVLSSAPL